MFINLPDEVKLAITKALRDGCSTNDIALQFNMSSHYARCCRNAFCPDLVKPVTVQSYAAVYRQYCDLRYELPRIQDICRNIGISNDLPGEVVTIPELKSSGQELELTTVHTVAAAGRTEVKVQIKGSKIAFAVDNAALVSTVVGIIKGLYV